MREKGAKQQWRQALAMRALGTRRLILSRLPAPGRLQLVVEEGDNTPASDVLDVASNRVIREIEAASRETLLRRLQRLERAGQKARAPRPAAHGTGPRRLPPGGLAGAVAVC